MFWSQGLRTAACTSESVDQLQCKEAAWVVGERSGSARFADASCSVCRRGFSQSRVEFWAASFATCSFVGSPLGSALAVSLLLLPPTHTPTACI